MLTPVRSVQACKLMLASSILKEASEPHNSINAMTDCRRLRKRAVTRLSSVAIRRLFEQLCRYRAVQTSLYVTPMHGELRSDVVYLVYLFNIGLRRARTFSRTVLVN